jgi:hypothetical protein
MSPQRRLFLVTWLVGLAALYEAWTRYGVVPAVAADEAALQALSVVLTATPWVAGPGVLVLLRRMPSGGVNLPHAEYWFTGERRGPSLDRLAPYLDRFGTWLQVFLIGVLALFIYERVDPRAASVSALMFLAWTMAFLGGTVWWVRRVMAAFPEPDAATRGVKRFRRPRRPGR